MKTAVTIALAALAAALLAGCATFPVQEAYASTDSLRIEIAPAAHGEREARLSGGPLLGAVLSGEAVPDRAGGWEVSLIGMKWFNNWPNGWTEATFVADGSFDLLPSQGGFAIRVKDAPEIDAPSAARIRYFSDYYGGTEALEQLTRRWNRIEAYAGFLQSRHDSSWFGDRRRVRRFLFPELYGYDQPPEPGHASVLADSIRWNTDYTKKEFPENLRPLRDSGTMLRDYEESPELWALAVRWDTLWTAGMKTRVFHAVKH